MSLIRAIKHTLGLSVTPDNNFTFDASADNGTMKLARGNAGATTQDIMTVDAAGKVAFPAGLSSLTLTATQAASGTIVNFINIPEWARRITIQLSSISLSGNSVPVVQIGDSGGLETSGYVGSSSRSSSGSMQAGALTSDFPCVSGGASAGLTYSGTVVLTSLSSDGLTWICSSSVGNSNGEANWCSGNKTLSSRLTRVAIFSFNGIDTFDNGHFSAIYEG